MSEWSLWGPCSKKKKLCGFRKGSEERTRRVLHAPGGDHTICSNTKETRRCTVRRIPCPEGELQPLPPWGWGSGTAAGGLATCASCLWPRRGPQARARWGAPTQDPLLCKPVPNPGRGQPPELCVVGAGRFCVHILPVSPFLLSQQMLALEGPPEVR